MKGTRIMRRSIATLLAVLLLVGCFSVSAFSVSYGFAGSDAVDISYENGEFTVLFSSEKLATVLNQKKVTIEDMKAFFPDQLLNAWRNDGIAGVLANDDFAKAFPLDELLKLIPQAIVDQVFTPEAVEKVADPEVVYETLSDQDKLDLYELITGKTYTGGAIDYSAFTGIDLTGKDMVDIISKAVSTGTINNPEVKLSRAELQEILSQAIYKVFTYTDDLTINGDSVWVNYKVDESLLEKTLLKAIPTKAELTNPANPANLAELTVHFDIDDGLTAEDVDVSVVVGVFGNADISALADYISYDDENGVAGKLFFTGDQYTALLTSDDVDTEVKQQIIDFFSKPISEVIATIEDYDVATIVAIFDATMGSDVEDPASLSDFSESKTKRVYDLAITMLKALPESVQSKSFAEQYDDESGAFVMTYKFGSLTNKALGKASQRVGKNIIDEFFTYNASTAANTTVTLSLADTNIVKVSFVVSGSNSFTYETFLPVGFSFEDLAELNDSLDLDFVDEDGNAVTEVPSEDITVYYNDKYAVVFLDEDGNEITTVYYILGDTEIVEPEFPEKEDYYGNWSEYELGSAEVIYVSPVYYEMYSVVFVDEDGNEIAVVKYIPGVTTEIDEPACPEKEDYYGGWTEYTLGEEPVIYVYPVYEKIPFIDKGYYAVIFYEVRGDEVITIDVVRYKPGARSIVEPPVPSKPGYTGTWAPYALNEAIVVSTIPVYTQNETYTVVFVNESGKEVARVDYLVGVTSIEEPAVPAKAGFIGAWEPYTLGVEKTITVKPVYTVDPSTTTEKDTTETTEKITTESSETVTTESTETVTTESTKVTETVTTESTKVTETETETGKVTETTDGGDKTKGNLTWLWVLLVIILLLVIIILLLVFKRKKSDDDENKEDENKEDENKEDSEKEDDKSGEVAGAAAAGAAASEEAPTEETSSEEAPAEEPAAEEAPAEEPAAEEAPAEEPAAEEAPAEEPAAEEAPAEEPAAEETPAEEPAEGEEADGEDKTKSE